jgi:hypothetical protein
MKASISCFIDESITLIEEIPRFCGISLKEYNKKGRIYSKLPLIQQFSLWQKPYAEGKNRLLSYRNETP